MPFSDYAIDPARIEVVRAAFRKVCGALHLNCGPGDPTTELVVMRIVEFAKAGEIDPSVLCSRVLQDFETRPPSTSGDPGPPKHLAPR
jgi:hypothetical protein